MCLNTPKPKKPVLLPEAPPTPEEPPKAVVKNETSDPSQSKKKGRTSLKIDLNPAASSGLRL